ncbi:hypothetical protein HN371_06370 [Candidatus Poribacteria bacterium]|nr:hypothetical protein [Candidatus Poribacteria bacterium]MBT5713432.1 hypothetical protein [Candidatus Poribacteria bacterium]MBT7096769.1 hypothetical protein [Candidatus Poribacteria bacterium]MBT7806767.1 hypothetical protein [Candidatus Poribacteria bacterium]
MTNPLPWSRSSMLASLLVAGTLMAGVRAFAAPTPWTASIEANGLVDGVATTMLPTAFGIAQGATDGFDGEPDGPQDDLAPPPAPSFPLGTTTPSAHFYAAKEERDWLRSMLVDLRGFPAVAAADVVWTLVVDAEGGFPPHVTDWHLAWDVSEIDAYWADVRMTNDDGMDIDMRETATLPVELGVRAVYTIRVRSVAVEVRAPGVAPAGEAITIEALVGEFPETITRATLYYARGGETLFRTKHFAQGVGGVWTVRVPRTYVTTRGVLWYTELDDTGTGRQRTYSASAPGGISVVGPSSLTLAPTPGPQPVWNALAPAVWPDIAALGSTFDDADGGFLTEWFAWRWNALTQRWESAGPLGDATPVATDDFAPGHGWLVAVVGDVDETRQVIGQSVDPTRGFGIPLSVGWNLLANPFAFAVAWSDATIAVDDGGVLLTASQAASAGVADNRIYYLDGPSQAYVARDSDEATPYAMPPGQGWWLHADGAAATLLIAPVAAE